MRASKLLAALRSSDLVKNSGLEVVANDERGVLRLSGSAASIGSASRFIELFDIKPRDLEIKIQVASEADRSSYDATVRMHNMQMMKVEDSDTKLVMGFQPRINDDGTVTLRVVLQGTGGSIESTVRMRIGQNINLTGPGERTQSIFFLPYLGRIDVQTALKGPTVNLSLVRVAD